MVETDLRTVYTPTLTTAHPLHNLPSTASPDIMHGEIKAGQAHEVPGQKFELKKKEDGGSLSFGAPSPEGKLAHHLCRLHSHGHHPWTMKRKKGESQEIMEGKE